MLEQKHPLVGKRIQLIYTSDPYANLPFGECGTIKFVDDMGTLHVQWDNGCKLGLLPGEDKWKILEPTN
jgi:hypothetical protein